MNHRIQKGLSLAAFATLLLISLACAPYPGPARREPPSPPSSPLSVPEREFPKQESAVDALAFDGTGRWMATGAADGKIALWDFNTRLMIWKAEDRASASGASPVRAVIFRSNGDAVLSAAASGVVRIHDAKSGKLINTLDVHQSDIRVAAFSPDGRLLALAGGDSNVKLWNLESNVVVHTLTGHTGAVNALEFSADGKMLASGGADRTIRLWNAETGEALRVLPGQEDSVSALAYWPDGTRLASATAHDGALSHRGRYEIWNTQNGTRIQESTPIYAVLALATKPDERLLAWAYRCEGNWSCVEFVRLDQGLSVRRYVAHRGRTTSMTFTADGTWLVTAGTDGAVRVWR